MADAAVLDRLRPGDHVCWTFDDDHSRMDVTAAFVRSGLTAQHKVVCRWDSPAALLSGLRRHGVDTEAALSTRQLEVDSTESTYLVDGAFSAELSIDGWNRQIAQARLDGYRVMHALGDMSWAARPYPGLDQLPSYEAKANRIFADGFVIGVCLYDRRLFDPLAMRRVTAAHLSTVAPEADCDVLPLLRILRTHDPIGVRLEGEADLSNRYAMAAMLGPLLEEADPEGAPLTLDLSDLRFADNAATRILARAVIRAGDRVRVVGHTPALGRLLAFNGAGAAPGGTDPEPPA
jgi:anti-anti-sigma factor